LKRKEGKGILNTRKRFDRGTGERRRGNGSARYGATFETGGIALAAKPWWRETIETILWALALALILRTFVVQAFWIPSGSMIPTLEIGDRVLVAKFWYTFSEPKRGQIAVFKYPVDPQRDFVKRIIGLPGETVSMKDGVVYIDGNPIDDSYVRNHDYYDMEPVKVPEGQYFVLGDNRPNSQDARFWPDVHKFVPRSYLKGPAFVRYWPIARIGLLE
jgi:signal peptidase I